ncbi:hypothetical protein NIES4106_42250 [Fischerella sp. NIES-4106]|jgi:hypothetical protein|nr:hypothetical protein NIES4106_42250 [Fischerella sp. NIES-4106]
MQYQFFSVRLFKENGRFPSHTQFLSCIVQLYHIKLFVAMRSLALVAKAITDLFTQNALIHNRGCVHQAL